MRANRSVLRFLRRISVGLVLLLAIAVSAGPHAAAQSASPWQLHRPNVVVLGDSFAAGVGNLPYDTNSAACKRSQAAYGPLLARSGLVTLQAFVACSGATTTQVSGPGPNREPAQIDAITSATDIVTVQALGNDFYVGAIEGLCFAPQAELNCSLDSHFPPGTPLEGKTVGEVVASIPVLGPKLLDNLYDQISKKLKDNRRAKVIVVGYPNIVGNGGIYCPGLTSAEVVTAKTMVANLNKVLRDAAQRHHFRFAAVDSLFRGHDGCGLLPAIYPPLPPEPMYIPPASPDGGGALHPNQFGQALYAAAVGKRLFF